jgi:hypothetical protein
MPTIVRLGNVRIVMFFNDHLPPHFHVMGAGVDAAIRIADLELMAGYIDPRTARIVVQWATQNRERLENLWSAIHG